jgi:adenylate cyclase
VQSATTQHEAALPQERRITFRVGINLGDIVVEDDDIFGDGVNIAARLEGISEPGGICLSASAHEQVRGKVELEFADLGELSLRNIARPVRAYRALLDRPPSPEPKPSPDKPSLAAIVLARWRGPMIAGLAASLIAAGLVAWLLERPRPNAAIGPAAPLQRAERTSIAVLPLRDLSSDSGQNALADGISEAVGNALGRFSNLAVVGKSATLSFGNRNPSPEEVGRTLGVRYLIEGSLRRAGDRLRITAELAEAPTGRQLWSEVYNPEAKDIFAAQDDVVQRIVGGAAATLTRVEHDRVLRKPIGELAPYEYLLRARADFSSHTRDKNEEARSLAQRVIELDPNYAEAHSALGWAYYEAAVSGWSEFPHDDVDRAEALAQKAAGLDPALTSAYNLLANVFFFRGEYDRALAQSDRALSINPNDAPNPALRSLILIYAGKPAEAAKWAQESLRLDAANSQSALALGLAGYFLGQCSEAIEAFDRALARDPGRSNQLTAHPVLAACYARLGRASEAERERAIVARLSPFFDAERFAAQFGTQAAHDDMLAGLREAGFR